MTRYFASFDPESGEPDALIRLVVDDAAEELHLERLTAEGTWQDDPTLIDEIREPGVRELEASEFQDVVDSFAQKREIAADPELSGEDAKPASEVAPPNSVR